MHSVSVLMPAYNCEKYIAESISSILNQTFTNFEFIIINDGSTDGTHNIIASFKDSRIKYLQNSSNEGLSNVRNKLINLATGDYIAFLDSDDYSVVNRLEIQFASLNENSEIGLVASSVKAKYEDGKEDTSAWMFDLILVIHY